MDNDKPDFLEFVLLGICTIAFVAVSPLIVPCYLLGRLVYKLSSKSKKG